MATPVELGKYQILIAPDSKKVQGLRTGDIVRRQYFDGANVIYSLMCVLSYGTTKRFFTEAQYGPNGEPVFNADGTIRTQNVEKDVPYFIGALLEGDPPKASELLDFARITNLFDAGRSGALYLTASDDNAPFMDVVDGLGRNKSVCWPEGIASEAFEDPRSQYIVRGDGLGQLYKGSEGGQNRIVRLTRNSESEGFCGLWQDFYELVEAQKRVLVSYKARANKSITVNAEIGYSDGNAKDAEWTEDLSEDWRYHFQAINVLYSGRHLRTFRLDLKNLGINDWVEVADFNIILLDSISNFGDATSMRMGKLDGVDDPVFGTLSGYGAYIQKLYASKTAHISGTLTAGDENGFASTFYAGKIHRNCFINSCDVNFLSSITIDNDTLLNPTGMGNVYKTTGSSELVMFAQSRGWLNANAHNRYCFSFWGYSCKPCRIGVKQNGKTIGTIQISSGQCHEWRRLHVFFDLLQPEDGTEDLLLGLAPAFSNFIYQPVAGSPGTDEQVLFITAPQLEAGGCCTQYQPTDDVLNETNDYGAWLALGGIGGTIQNPLLKLNKDGSIASKNKSFVINSDGSGHFANGRFKWDSDSIVLKGIVVKWEDLDDQAKEELKPKSISLIGGDVFVETSGAYSPSAITVQLSETNFASTSSNRKWYYSNSEGGYSLFDGQNGKTLPVSPTAGYWGGRDTLTIKCEVSHNGVVYVDTMGIRKTKNGEDVYSVSITTSNGNIFKNGAGTTTLTAKVYKGSADITDQFNASNFNWVRVSGNPAEDLAFNESHAGFGNVLVVHAETVASTVQFDCEVLGKQ